MQRDRPSTDRWFLQDAKARVACGPLLAVLDVERPMLGLRNLQLPGETLDGWLMGVDVRSDGATANQRWEPADVYIRNNDLVAAYREPAGQPLYLQVYWRVIEPKRLMAGELEVLVSIHTREWEAYPFVAISSALNVPHARLNEGGVNFISRHDWSYVEASPSGDFESCLGESPSGLNSVSWSYGKRFMERGVISRLRLRGAFTPIDNAEDAIEQIHAEFASEPPPLTA